MKRAIIVVTIRCLWATTIAFGQSSESKHFPGAAKRIGGWSVVKVTDLTRNTTGSGFICSWNQGLFTVMTAAHCVAGKRLRVRHISGKVPEQDIDVLAYDEKRDLALLSARYRPPRYYAQALARLGPSFDGELLPTVLKICPKEFALKEKIPVLTFGFPNGNAKRMFTRTLGTTEMRISEYSVAGRFWRLAKVSAPGQSGGPVICLAGDDVYAIGVWFGREGKEGRAASLGAIHAFLDDHGYSQLYRDPIVNYRSPRDATKLQQQST